MKLPLGTKLYLRVNWKDVQQRPGKLDLCEHWKLTFELARRYRKRIGFRVMMSNPDIPDSPLPEFLRDKIPMVKLGDWLKRTRYEPRYDSILRFSRRFGSWWTCWRMLTMAIQTSSMSTRSCMDSGARVIPGLLKRIRFPMR